MRKQLIRVTVVAAVLTLLVAAAAPPSRRWSGWAPSSSGTTAGSRRPNSPGTSMAPISANLNAKIGTTDGSHPPAVRSVNLDFDKTIQVNARGLPVCTKSQLVARSTAAAKNACADAIIGSGEGEVEVAFPEQQPFSATGPILLFNGGVHGGTTLVLIHTYVAVPAPTAVIATAKLTKIHRGRYGTHVVAADPVDRRRRRLGHQVQADDRPQLHLQRQEAELPDRQLPDRALLHRRRSRVRRRHHTGDHPRPALHPNGIAK